MADNVYEGRNAEILEATINGTEYTDPPQSRIEELLLELKSVIEAGGGGSASLSDLIEDVTGYPLNDYASMSLYSKDLNTITKSGFYNAMTCTNAPFDYMTLTVIGYYLQGYTVQIACDVTTGEVKKRNNINGTWSAWTTTKELPAVTTDDNEKVLMVKEGAWDKAETSGGATIYELEALGGGKYQLADGVLKSEIYAKLEQGDTNIIIHGNNKFLHLTAKNGQEYHFCCVFYNGNTNPSLNIAKIDNVDESNISLTQLNLAKS